jgi:hypothetical protein
MEKYSRAEHLMLHTHTHKYAILILFLLQQWLHGHTSILHVDCVSCSVFPCHHLTSALYLFISQLANGQWTH